MAKVSIRKLRQQASLALRGGDFAEAISLYAQLEVCEPTSPLWPQRKADAYRELGRDSEEFAALQVARAAPGGGGSDGSDSEGRV